MKKWMKFTAVVLTTALTIGSSIDSTGLQPATANAAKKMSLSKTKLSLTVGASAKLTIKNKN